MISSDFYNTIAHYYDDYCTFSHINNFLEEELTLVETYTPSSILEFGVGTGRFAKAYLQRNPHTIYFGVDNSKEMIDQSKDIKATLILDDFENFIDELIINNKHFDCVVAPYTALHHIETKEQQYLLEKIIQVSNLIIINCLNKKTEASLFKKNNNSEVTMTLPDSSKVTTTIYKISPSIRGTAVTIPSGTEREYLVFDYRFKETN